MKGIQLGFLAAAATVAFGAFSGSVSYALASRKAEPTTIIRGLGGVPALVQRVATSPDEARTVKPFHDGEYVEVICTTASHMKLGDSNVEASFEDKLVAPNVPSIYNTGPSSYASFVSEDKGYCWVTALR